MATRKVRKPITFSEAKSGVVVLYAASGEILHAVTISADEESDMPSQAEAERIARECAAIAEDITTASVLHVSNRDFDRNAVMKVDPKTRKLVRTTVAKPPSKPAAAKRKPIKKTKRG